MPRVAHSFEDVTDEFASVHGPIRGASRNASFWPVRTHWKQYVDMQEPQPGADHHEKGRFRENAFLGRHVQLDLGRVRAQLVCRQSEWIILLRRLHHFDEGSDSTCQ